MTERHCFWDFRIRSDFELFSSILNILDVIKDIFVWIPYVMQQILSHITLWKYFKNKRRVILFRLGFHGIINNDCVILPSRIVESKSRIAFRRIQETNGLRLRKICSSRILFHLIYKCQCNMIDKCHFLQDRSIHSIGK